MTTRTAICRDTQGNEVPVQCKLWENWHGATNLANTEEQLRRDQPDLTFVAWVQDRDSLPLYFLSPNVEFVKVWLETAQGFALTTVKRAEV